MQIAVVALVLHAFVAAPSTDGAAHATDEASVPSSLQRLKPAGEKADSPQPGSQKLAQAEDDEPFGDPPPPPTLTEESEAAPAPVLEPAPSASSSREQRREQRRLAREGRKQQRQERSRQEADDDEPIDAMMAGIITAAGSVVVAVPAAGFCGICTCLACPGPLACVPVATAASAAGGLLFAGADIDEVLLPAAAAGAISFASGVLGIGSALLYMVASGAALNYAAGVPMNPTLTQGISGLNLVVYGGLALGCMSLGAAGAGGAVYLLTGGGGDDEEGDVARAEPVAPSSHESPTLLATTTTMRAMAY